MNDTKGSYGGPSDFVPPQPKAAPWWKRLQITIDPRIRLIPKWHRWDRMHIQWEFCWLCFFVEWTESNSL